jgi:DNA-binding protein HU-beta
MTRSQLITKVANDTNMTAAEVEKVMDGIFGTIGDVLKSGDKVTIAGFGRFEMRPRKPKAYTNPKTKVSSRLESTSIPGFKASGRFKQKLEAGRAAKSVEETA